MKCGKIYFRHHSLTAWWHHYSQNETKKHKQGLGSCYWERKNYSTQIQNMLWRFMVIDRSELDESCIEGHEFDAMDKGNISCKLMSEL